MDVWTFPIPIIAALFAGAGSFYLFRPTIELDPLAAERKLKEAEAEATRLRMESEQKLEAIRKAMAAEEQSVQESLEKTEKLITQKEEILKRKEERNQAVQSQLRNLEDTIRTCHDKQKNHVKKVTEELSKYSGLTEEKALETVRTRLENLIKEGADRRLSAELEEREEGAPRHAKALLQVVIQRLGVTSSVDKNNTSVLVRDDKFKGLLIGKNGTNIEYLESLLPVSIIFNLGDPKTIHVGGVNLLRRNIAKRAIEKMQTWVKKQSALDHPTIKQAVEEAEKEIMQLCDQKGVESLKLLGLDPKQVPEELVNYTGRLYFRTSYGQNVTGHSNEMALAARMLADLIGANTDVAMQAAFYHDIGKAIDHDVGGAHDDLSKEILEKHGYDSRIVHAAYAHHDKVPCISPEDFIVKAVDAISGGRPGARQESVTNYFERIQKLEETALSFEGVNKVFAMSAGRELRVMVDRDRIQDEHMKLMADEMAAKITENVAFPGVIKVNLIRLTKAVDYARELVTKRGRSYK